MSTQHDGPQYDGPEHTVHPERSLNPTGPAPVVTASQGGGAGDLRSIDPFSNLFAMPGPDVPPRVPVDDHRPQGPGGDHAGDDLVAGPSGQMTFEPCRCACGCTNPSDVQAGTVVAMTALGYIRCRSCFDAGHTKTPAGTPRPLTASQQQFTGARTGKQIVVTKPHVDDDDARHDARIAAELAQRRWDEAAARWMDQVPERFRAPIDEPLEPQITDILGRLAAKDGSHYLSMLSLGPFGSGKTWMAYVLARRVVEQRLIWPAKIRIVKERALLEPLVTGDQWDRHKVLGKMLDKDRLAMLVIDDVGTYKGGKDDDRISAYTEIVDWFYMHNLPLVMTSNLPLGPKGGDFAKAIGGAAWDRLKNMLGPHGVLFRDEEAQRGKYAQQWEEEFKARGLA